MIIVGENKSVKFTIKANFRKGCGVNPGAQISGDPQCCQSSTNIFRTYYLPPVLLLFYRSNSYLHVYLGHRSFLEADFQN